MSKQLPPIAYSDQHNGLLDPQRPTITERLRTSPPWLDQQPASLDNWSGTQTRKRGPHHGDQVCVHGWVEVGAVDEAGLTGYAVPGSSWTTGCSCSTPRSSLAAAMNLSWSS